MTFHWEKKVILKLHQLLEKNSKFVLVREVKMPFYMSASQCNYQAPFPSSPPDTLLYIYKKVD